MTRLRDGYETRHPWPDDCQVQGGSSGLVLSKTRDSYRTAFFEAFPTEPQTFIRGEGATLAEAEDAAWAKYQRVSKSDHEHEFETRGYRNGAGFCKHCGLFASGVFDLASIGSVCVVCGTGTYWTHVGDDLYCEEHAPSSADRRRMRAELRAEGKDIPYGLNELFDDLLDEDDAC